MTGAFGRWLNSLTGPTQILIRAERVDLSAAIAWLKQTAPLLPHPSLEDAALERAAFLADLAASRDLLRRQVILVICEPAYRGRGDAAVSRAMRRADDAARALAAAGVRAAVLDAHQAAAVTATYEKAGITSDPATWSRPAPLMRDLAEVLAASGDQAGRDLGARLAPYVTGSWRGLFDGPSTARPSGHLTVYSLRDLPEELRPPGTLLTLDATWQRVSNPRTGGPAWSPSTKAGC